MPAPQSPHREAWGAMLHVRPLPGKDGGLSGGAGAYAWVYALATDETDYRERVAADMESLDLFVAEIEDLDIYEIDDANGDEANACLERLSETWPVQYCNFHIYPADES